jgi:hypothetical protein
VAAGCGQPDPLLICHNSNCGGELDIDRDDTLAALQESLALTISGRPPFDGVEIDTVWVGSQERCVFAHEVDEDAPDAAAAGEIVAGHLLGADRPSWNGDRFVLKIEVKPVVGPDLQQHDASQELQHAECALDLAWSVLDAATAAGIDVEVIADSNDDGLLRAVARRPRWMEIPRRRLSADFGAPWPFTHDTPRLSDFAGVALDLVEFHPEWLAEANVEAFRSLDVDFVIWMFSATPEVLAAIRTYEPAYVNTGEAALMRRWIDR